MENKGEGGNDPMLSALHQPFFDELTNSKNILIAGCGGGYDFFSGLPLYLAFLKTGRTVYLANLAFTGNWDNIVAERITPSCIEVTADTIRDFKHGQRPFDADEDPYFPELQLSKWFRDSEKMEVPVYMLERTGVKPLREAYEALVKKLDIDTIIAADGGTDSLMTGDESGLGTPTEDMATIGALKSIKKVKKYLVCLGFGIDFFHGVCHSHFLENTAKLSATGGFLGTFSLMPQMVEAQKFKQAYLKCTPANSIVCSSILSAVEGEFGNYHRKETKARTAGSKLYISPLMSMYWAYSLDQVAKQVFYLKHLKDTTTSGEVRQIIHKKCEKFYKNGKYNGTRVETPIPY